MDTDTDKILVFTVTATSFPIQRTFGLYPAPSELAMYERARVLRFTYQTYRLHGEKEGEPVETVDMYVKSGIGAITQACIDRTGITKEFMETTAQHTVHEFSERFFNTIKNNGDKPVPILCYNASLQFHLFGSELYRHGLKEEFKLLTTLLPEVFCLMQQCVDVCKIPSERKNIRYKTPSMFDITCTLLPSSSSPPPSSSSHDNLHHIEQVARCFFALKNTYYSRPTEQRE